MIRDKEERIGPIVIDLTGPDGNVFTLMALAKRFAKQLDIGDEKIIEQMMATDYENALLVFDKYFGDYVILQR